MTGELNAGAFVRDQASGMTLERHAALVGQHVARALQSQPLVATVDEQHAYARMQYQDALNSLSTGGASSRSW